MSVAGGNTLLLQKWQQCVHRSPLRIRRHTLSCRNNSEPEIACAWQPDRRMHLGSQHGTCSSAGSSSPGPSCSLWRASPAWHSAQCSKKVGRWLIGKGERRVRQVAHSVASKWWWICACHQPTLTMDGTRPSAVTRARSMNWPKGRPSGEPWKMAMVALFSKAVRSGVGQGCGGKLEAGGG